MHVASSIFAADCLHLNSLIHAWVEISHFFSVEAKDVSKYFAYLLLNLPVYLVPSLFVTPGSGFAGGYGRDVSGP